MKKIPTLAAALFAAAVFSSAPLMAQDVASVEAVVAQYQTLVTQYQGENMTAEQAQTQALADIKSQVQAMLEAAPDQETKEILLQAALEAAVLLDDAAVSAILAAAVAAGMSADSITAVAAASQGIDQDLVAQATASGGPAAGATGLAAGPGAAAPGGAGFGGGSGGGGGTASAN